MTQVHITNEIDTAVIAIEKTAVDTDENRADFLDFVRKDMLHRLTIDTSEVFRPFHIQIMDIQASYCATDEEIEAFKAGHECEQCSQVKPAAHANLAEFPESVIVMMNIHLRKFFLNPLTP